MRIALAQINPTVGDLSGNQKLIVSYIKKARKKGADIVIFPELAITGYPPEDLLHKEHFVQDNLKALRSVTKETKGITAVIGFADFDKSKNVYNAAAVVRNGQFKGVYHKQVLPNYGVFDEKRYFSAGQESPLFLLNGILLGINVCEDIWVDKSTFDAQVKAGAQLIINISSSPYNAGKLTERENLLKSRAKKSKIHVCYVNLIGGQDELVFDGGSIIVDPKGKRIANGRQFEEDLIVVDLDVPSFKGKGKSKKIISLSKTASKVKSKPLMPHLSQRYNKLERVYRALVLGTHDYIKKNGFKKVIIGISGGIDSALVSAIAVDAIGSENVIGISLPSRYTSSGTRSDARSLAQNLNIEFKEIPIEETFKSYLEVLDSEFAGLKPNIAEENIQARIRGNIIMALSNKFGWLVLTTGNKSEFAVGYCTLYGDMSGGFAIIKDVPKTMVYQLVRLRNMLTPGLIPESILTRAPSAELRDNQKDQDSLPDYNVLDGLLEHYVEHHDPISVMAKNGKRDLAKKIITMVDHSEYKRRQSPPGIKITQRSFDKDWRLPITNKYKEFK